MNELRISPRAQADLDGIWDYVGIESDRPLAASRLIEMLYEKFSFLAENPQLGESRPDLGDDLRGFVAGRYLIVYRVRNKVVEVVRVVHGARDIRKLFGD